MQCSAVQKDCNPLLAHTHPRPSSKRHEAFFQACSVLRGAQPPVGPEAIRIGVDGGIHVNTADGHAGGCLHLLVSDSISLCMWREEKGWQYISTSRALCLRTKREGNTYSGRNDPFGSLVVGIDEWLRRRNQRKSGGESGGDSQRFFDDCDLCVTVPEEPR